MNQATRFRSNASNRTSVAKAVVVAAGLLLGWAVLDAVGAVGQGAAALLVPGVADKLGLSDAQRQQIQSITRATAKTFSDAQTARRGQPGLKDELARIRQAGQDEALALLTPAQKDIWAKLAGQDPPARLPAKAKNADSPKVDETAARSLIIPSIQELKNPPSRGAYGPNASLLQTRPHPPRGEPTQEQ